MKSLVFLDTETTDIANGRIIEIALAEGNSKIVHSYRFRPPSPINLEAMAVHHITEEMVKDLLSFSESPSAKEVKARIGTNVVVAHNAPFDIRMLEAEGIQVHEYIDTCRLAKILLPDARRNTLQYLRYYLGVSVRAEAHTAVGDVQVLKEIFNMLSGTLARDYWLDSEQEIIEKAIELSRNGKES